MNMETMLLSNCPACEFSGWKIRHRIREWSICECRRCAYAMVYPVPTAESRPAMYAQDQVVKRNACKKHVFSRHIKRLMSKSFGRTKTNIFQKKIFQNTPAGGVILDVGCGDGGFIYSFHGKYECWGLEISDYLAGRARTQEGLRVIQEDFQTADFGGQKFDAITIISLIEHLTDPLAALQKCHALLKENGVLFLKTPNYACLNHSIFRGDKWIGLRPPDHVVYFTPRNMIRILKRAGFRKTRIQAWPFNDNMYCDARK